MKKINTLLLALAIVAVLLFGSSANIPAAHAQATCLDAAGAPIPCPPTEAPTETPTDGSDNDNSGGGSQPGGGNSNPATVATATPEPTSTPLPLAAPTDDGSTEATWQGNCRPGKDSSVETGAACVNKLINSCINSGGDVWQWKEDDGSMSILCIIPSVLNPNPLSLDAPEEDNLIGTCSAATGNALECLEELKLQCEDGLLVVKVDLYAPGGTNYKVFCIPDEQRPQINLPINNIPNNGSTTATFEGICWGDESALTNCSDTFKALCDEEGGAYSEFYEDNGSLYAVCENSSETSPTPTEAPAIAAAPEGDGSNEGKGQECSWAGCWFDRVMCVVNGGFYNDTVDHKGVTTFTCDHYNEDGTPVEGGAPAPNWGPWVVVGGLAILIGLLLPAVQKIRDAATRMPQTKEHVLLNKDNGGTEAHDVFLDIGHPPGETKGKMPNNEREVAWGEDDGGGDQQPPKEGPGDGG